MKTYLCALLCLLCGVAAGGAPLADEPTPSPTPAAAETRPTGLPKGVEWTFNIDATIGAFGFHNSFYTDPKPEQPSGDLGDNWFEGAVTPALTATYTSPRSWQVYGKASVVGERTYGADPTVLGADASSFGVEDLAIGWRSGDVLGKALGANVLELSVGRVPYELGHGFLIWDGAAEGGTRGGYWTNARKAFELAAIGKFAPGDHTFEAFYLDKDDLPEADSESRLWGANYEYAIGEESTIGATYMSWSADTEEAPERDGLEVYNLRVFTAPFSGLRGLSFEAEYALEDNGEALDSYAWTALAAYQLGSAWTPRLSYRYAFFEGDDPDTLANESFDPLFTGFYDWGTWWQGEIAGEYFVSNSNLISHQLRVHTAPLDTVESGLILYDFRLHRPAAFEVTADDVALEADWYLDWSVNDNVTINFLAAYADPGEAVEQSSGRTEGFTYGMVFFTYSY